MRDRPPALALLDPRPEPVQLADVKNRRPEHTLTDRHAAEPSRDLRQFPGPKVPVE
jgi:hypothetical protein